MQLMYVSAIHQIIPAHANAILQNFFWHLRNSCPYRAYGYDTLHADDGGKWGKHIWPLVLDVLGQLGMKGTLTMKYVISLLMVIG